ncbi:hypothetical protein SAMN04488074_103470 [Lentzea albidocapillata subsp. violacea]|uniref:Peptidase_C39 like family protein n=1 Tax=Lentzea albidocapillata subsp. violacea TaxID=128104 RepID=A0A1G8XG30_9PSEU|nr:hypothetical protein [Lentzea albidocapillata]SDJ89599.1 hypothetical protein SAMN04488074_103470 [Lentzea albidocapillata subsp. violacea]
MIRNALIAAAALTAVVAPATAVADPIIGTPPPCVGASDLAGADFNVKKCGVSDVDQHRAGLENNGGAYCGPASLYNVLHYWGHEKDAPVGWFTTKVGNLNPKDPADFSVITNSIGLIGNHAQYDGGTNLTNLRKAWDIATQPARNAGWTTSTGVTSTHNNADFAGELAKKLNEGPLQLVYGRYKAGPTTGSLQRSGGHIVTVVSATGSFNGSTIKLKLADPGRALDSGEGNYLYTQSAYESLDVTLAKKSIKEYIPVKDDENTRADESLEPGTYRTVTRWELTGPRYVSDTTRQMVEGFNWFDMAK